MSKLKVKETKIIRKKKKLGEKKTDCTEYSGDYKLELPTGISKR